MTEEEKYEIKKFIYHHNKKFKPYYQINEKEILTDEECETARNVLSFIMDNFNEMYGFFNYYSFLRPLIRKLARFLFYCGWMRLDECMSYLRRE